MNATPENYALIVYLAKSANGDRKLGKKALQKLVHLISEVARVPVGYRFRLYTYGPFSRELASDVDILDSLGAINVTFNADRNGYEISSASHANDYVAKAMQYIDENKKSIDYVVDRFGGKLAKELELYSMVTFILKEGLVPNIDDDESVVKKFREIKPHYTTQQVYQGLREIRELLH